MSHAQIVFHGFQALMVKYKQEKQLVKPRRKAGQPSSLPWRDRRAISAACAEAVLISCSSNLEII